MRYKYKAIDANGEITEDIHFAKNKEEVLDMIKSKSLFALSIEEDAQIDIRFDLFNRKVKKKDIIIFCKLFYTMLNAGINISKSLELIAENIKNLKLKFSIKEINKDIYKGSSLSDAM